MLSSNNLFDQAQFFQQQQLHQRHNNLQSQKQIEQQQQDSGTYSFESITRGQKLSNNNRGLFDAKDKWIYSYNPHFCPQRQGTLQSDGGFASIETSYNRFIDHNYATNSNNFDILHYAGEMNVDCEIDDLEASEERIRKISSSLNLPKRPCVDTPTSPFKLYRMKMFWNFMSYCKFRKIKWWINVRAHHKVLF